MEKQKWMRVYCSADEHPLQGDHFFAGETFVAKKVSESVPKGEILQILQDVKSAVERNCGLHFFQKVMVVSSVLN